MKQLQYVIRQSKLLQHLFNSCHQNHLCLHGPVHVRPVRQSSVICQSAGNRAIVNRVQGRNDICRTLRQCIQYRGLLMSSLHGTRSSVGVGSGQHHPEDEMSPNQTTHEVRHRGIPDSAWALRLSNENGFLSWCRNTYLASAVGCGMQAEGALEVSQVAAQGVFFLAGINLIWGTTSFVVHILALRRRVQMSLLGALLNISGAVLHLLTWLALVTMYLGLTEEDPEPSKDNRIQANDV